MNSYFCSLFLALTVFFTSAVADINHTTDRHVRDKYGCMVTTQNGVKPSFGPNEYFWVSNIVGYADLNQDKIPEIISGYVGTGQKIGGGVWARKPVQYGFYSTDPSFVHPKGTKFLAARTMLTQDFNSDGKDDVVFIQHGPDFAPHEPYHNEILLSQKDGYKTFYLAGGKSIYHGGAAGDFDNDGDVDIVATPGFKNEIKILFNDGTGKFSARNLTGYGRNYNIKTWDIDKDGNLDLIFDGHTEPVTILWGTGNGKFKNSNLNFTKLNTLDTMQDAVFVDHPDNTTEVILMSSAGRDEKTIPYYGYSVDKLTFKGRSLVDTVQIERRELKRYGIGWIPFIHLCDLKGDHKFDVVYELFGNSGISYEKDLGPKSIFLDKIIWERKESGYKKVLVLDSQTRQIPKGVIPKNYFHEDKLIETLGISLTKYLPKQTYAQKTAKKYFFDRYTKQINHVMKIFKPTVSVSKPNDPNRLSPKVKKLLEQIRIGSTK